MTLFSRVATVATMTLTLAGLVSMGTPAIAAETAGRFGPALGVVNVPILPAVPTATQLPATVERTAPVATPDQDSEDDEADREFASLADAVAAQDRDADDATMRCLAGAVYFESKGEPLHGQLAVAQVILNRAKSGRYPADVCGVVTQRGQFGFVRGGRIPAIDEARAAYRTAVAVARVALAGAWDSAASRALYFNTPGRAPGARLQRLAAIGNHVFYR